ncbi:MAG: hypothetical protein HKN78_05485 [Sphingomonadaceae bacterium]|nr:hypothetical protein [Sphingomonadaceae bacterium]
MRTALIPLAMAPLALAMSAAPLGAHPEVGNPPASVDEAVTFDAPIANIRNDYWYDYRSDLEEAEAELYSDLRRATDPEDEQDAWAEYVREIADAADDYAGEMAERGYRSGLVTIGGNR